MKPPAFAYARAGSVPEALAMLDEAGEEAKLLAGGQSLLPLLALRLARPSHLVDIGGIADLDRPSLDHTGLTLPALVTHATLEHHPELTGPWAALGECAGQIGHYPIRVRGTFGGSCGHGDPAAELPVVAVALDARFVLRSSERERTVPSAEFFVSPFVTALEPTEMLVAGHFPARAGNALSAFTEFAPRAGDFATASVAVALTLDDDGRARDVRIALGGVGPAPVRARTAERELTGRALGEGAITACARAATDSTDGRAGADLVPVLLARTLRRLAEKRLTEGHLTGRSNGDAA